MGSLCFCQAKIVEGLCAGWVSILLGFFFSVLLGLTQSLSWSSLWSSRVCLLVSLSRVSVLVSMEICFMVLFQCVWALIGLFVIIRLGVFQEVLCWSFEDSIRVLCAG